MHAWRLNGPQRPEARNAKARSGERGIDSPGSRGYGFPAIESAALKSARLAFSTLGHFSQGEHSVNFGHESARVCLSMTARVERTRSEWVAYSLAPSSFIGEPFKAAAEFKTSRQQ
jgi:hypothetical protein